MLKKAPGISSACLKKRSLAVQVQSSVGEQWCKPAGPRQREPIAAADEGEDGRGRPQHRAELLARVSRPKRALPLSPDASQRLVAGVTTQHTSKRPQIPQSLRAFAGPACAAADKPHARSRPTLYGSSQKLLKQRNFRGGGVVERPSGPVPVITARPPQHRSTGGGDTLDSD